MNPKNHNNALVKERITKLFSEAELAFDECSDLSKRYVVLARKLSTKFKVNFTPEQKRLFCKKCNSYLRNGKNSKVRLTSGRIVNSCLECGTVKRMNYKKTSVKS